MNQIKYVNIKKEPKQLQINIKKEPKQLQINIKESSQESERLRLNKITVNSATTVILEFIDGGQF